MNAQNGNTIFVIDSSAGGFSPPVNGPASTAGAASRRIKKNNQQPVVDVIVVLIALPSLTILALLLESSTRGNWLETAQSRYTVLGLGFGLAIVCLSLCIYVTTRLGGKIWSGAIPSDGNGPSYSYYSSRVTVDEFGDKPPSYEVVMGFEAPPPAYHTIIIEDEKVTYDIQSCSKMDAAQHI